MTFTGSNSIADKKRRGIFLMAVIGRNLEVWHLGTTRVYLLKAAIYYYLPISLF